MQDTALGLDIGSKTIKAVLLAGRVIGAEAVSIDAYGGLTPALEKLAQNSAFQNVPCCICLPLENVMLRQINLPFRDDNKIRKTLAFELEPLIPLAKGEIVTDYLKFDTGQLLVAAVTKKVIRDLIEAVENTLHADIAVIDISSSVLAYPVMEKRAADECAVILDIGAADTQACFYDKGAIVQMRSFSFGSEFLATTMAREMSIEQVDAVPILISGSAEDAGVGAGSACKKFCQDLKNTFDIMKVNGALKNDINRITVTGGGANFAFLIKELEDYFSLPVEILNLAGLNKIEIAQGLREKYQPQIMNTALAAAMRLFSRRKGFNFRQDEFAAKGARFNFKEQMRRAAIIAAAIIFLGIANLAGGYALEAYRANSIKKQIAVIFKKNYPEAQAMVDPLQQLKTKLAEDRKTFGLYEGAWEVAVVDILKEISVLIPSSMDVIVADFSYENGIALINGRAQSMDVVSAAKNELMKSRYFKDVVIGSTSLSKEADKVEFSLRIELK